MSRVFYCARKPPNGLRYPQGRERKTTNLFKAIKLRRDLPLSGVRCVRQRKERLLRQPAYTFTDVIFGEFTGY